MHELSIMMSLVKDVQKVMEEHEIQKVEKIVLQVGEVASVIPHYLRSCYPASVQGTELEDTVLVIEMIPANGLCLDCNDVFSLTANEGTCPKCHKDHYEMLSGREFILKEIVVSDG